MGVNSGCGLIFSSLWIFITKCKSYFTSKCNKSVLQNTTIITKFNYFITKCDRYEKMRQNTLVYCIKLAQIFQKLYPWLPSQPETFQMHFLQPIFGHSDKEYLVNTNLVPTWSAKRNCFFLVSLYSISVTSLVYFLLQLLYIVLVLLSSFS